MKNMNTKNACMDRETVSALMDGQVRGADLSAALRDMDTDEAREDWLVYHLVGDVLRSTDLARGRHDLALAGQVRQRLGAQPAQQPAPVAALDTGRPAANDGVFRWKLVAGLASLAAVAAVGWGTLGGMGLTPVGPQLAQAPGVRVAAVEREAASQPSARASGPGAIQVAALTPDAGPAAASATDEPAPVMLRDPRLDELLAAHRAAAGASALGNTAGFLRNATFQGAGR